MLVREWSSIQLHAPEPETSEMNHAAAEVRATHSQAQASRSPHRAVSIHHLFVDVEREVSKTNPVGPARGRLARLLDRRLDRAARRRCAHGSLREATMISKEVTIVPPVSGDEPQQAKCSSNNPSPEQDRNPPPTKKRTSRIGVRDEIVPQCFVAALARELPGFTDEPWLAQVARASLVWRTGTKQQAHSEWDGLCSITYQELERIFGRGGFKTVNQRLKIFCVTPKWSQGRESTDYAERDQICSFVGIMGIRFCQLPLCHLSSAG
jgi:hypothetical protein